MSSGAYDQIPRRYGESSPDSMNFIDFRIHDFRHTAVKNWVDSGANIFTVQAASGHKTQDMLGRYYTVTDYDLRAMAATNLVRIRSELQVEAR